MTNEEIFKRLDELNDKADKAVVTGSDGYLVLASDLDEYEDLLSQLEEMKLNTFEGLSEYIKEQESIIETTNKEHHMAVISKVEDKINNNDFSIKEKRDIYTLLAEYSQKARKFDKNHVEINNNIQRLNENLINVFHIKR